MPTTVLNNQQKAAALWLSVALGAIEAVKEMEIPKSARWNRLEGAVSPINRAIDQYRLSSFPIEDMANASALLDIINAEIRRLYP